MEPNRSCECAKYEKNPKYDDFVRKFNPYGVLPENCGTCGHYGELGCVLGANVFVMKKKDED